MRENPLYSDSWLKEVGILVLRRIQAQKIHCMRILSKNFDFEDFASAWEKNSGDVFPYLILRFNYTFNACFSYLIN